MVCTCTLIYTCKKQSTSRSWTVFYSFRLTRLRISFFSLDYHRPATLSLLFACFHQVPSVFSDSRIGIGLCLGEDWTSKRSFPIGSKKYKVHVLCQTFFLKMQRITVHNEHTTPWFESPTTGRRKPGDLYSCSVKSSSPSRFWRCFSPPEIILSVIFRALRWHWIVK